MIRKYCYSISIISLILSTAQFVQQVSTTNSTLPEGLYQIKSHPSNDCLADGHHAKLEFQPCSESRREIWNIEDVPDGGKVIRSLKRDDKCLSRGQTNTVIGLASCSSQDCETWIFEPFDNNLYQLKDPRSNNCMAMHEEKFKPVYRKCNQDQKFSFHFVREELEELD